MVVESDPFWSFPDQERLKQALDRVDLLLVMDYLPSRTARLAHIFLPTRTVFETETGFVNQEGRVQFATAAHCGGIPISQVAAGNHPPRVFRHDIPGGEPRPAWEILAKLACAMDSAEGEKFPFPERTVGLDRQEISRLCQFQSLNSREGVRVLLGQKKGILFHLQEVRQEKTRTGGQPRPSDCRLDVWNRRALCLLQTHPAG